MLLQSKLFEEGYFEFQIPFDSQKPGENSWNQNFTVFPVGNKEGQPFGDPRINVNLVDGDDIQQFLERFSNPGVNASDKDCLLYTSPSPRDRTRSRMPSSA